MPWAPELFSAPLLARLEEKRQRKLEAVPYFDGLMAGEPEALLGSFAAEPELHVPVRGRVRGTRAFGDYFSETSDWLKRHNVEVEDVGHVIAARHGFEEVVLHFDGEDGRAELPVAVVADRRSDGRIEELRIYFSEWLRGGHHAHRPPLLQPDPDLVESDVVGQFQAAVTAGDVDAIVATFEEDGFAREPAGGEFVHRGSAGLRAFYELLFSNGGGLELEHCAVIDDGRSCGLEYNLVRWGRTPMHPEAGFAVYARGPGGRLAAARIYDDANPPVSSLGS